MVYIYKERNRAILIYVWTISLWNMDLSLHLENFEGNFDNFCICALDLHCRFSTDVFFLIFLCYTNEIESNEYIHLQKKCSEDQA